MRICTTCKQRETRNKSSCYCSICHNEYQKKYYKKNPESISKSSKNRRNLIRDFIIKCKEVPCTDCGIQYEFYVMDFDHIKGEKKFNLSVAVRSKNDIKTIKKEIDKCEVVCSNCHRTRTFKRKQ